MVLAYAPFIKANNTCFTFYFRPPANFPATGMDQSVVYSYRSFLL